MGCLGMLPLLSSAQDILSTSGTSRWDYSNSHVERETGRDVLDNYLQCLSPGKP